MNPNMIHYAGENKPWNTDKVDFYDDFLENVINTPWEKEAYFRQLSLINSSNPAHNAGQTPVLLQTRIKKALMPFLNKYAPVGSPRRNTITKYYYKVRRSILG
jgi:lipopolysaccharide biosynthesis glycosyltransferase